MQKLIQDLGSWNVTDRNFSAATWDFMGTFVNIHKYLALAPLFNMYVGSDLKDSTKHIITVRSLSWKCKTREEEVIE